MTDTAPHVNADGSIEESAAMGDLASSTEGESQSTEVATGPEGSQEAIQEPSLEEKQRELEERIALEKFEKRRERREREQAQAELEQLRSELASSQTERPHIPPMPDQFDENFSEKLAEREQAIREAERFDAQLAWQQQSQVAALQEAAQAEQVELEAAAKSYKERATQLGVTDVELQRSGQRLVQSQALTEAELSLILSDEMGPLIAKYLTENLAELDKLASLPAGSSPRMTMLLTDIKGKASALKVKTTAAPDPVEHISGGGVTGERYPGTEGMTFM